MTSTIFLKNKNFNKLFRWTLDRNKGIMVAFAIIMAIQNVLELYIKVQYSTSIVDNTARFDQISYSSIVLAQLLAILFSVISSTHTFSFLHNKRSTDMFGAIPATRSTLYFSHLAGGILSVVIPFVVGSLGIMAVMCQTGQYVIYDLVVILFGIISIAAVYSFSVLIDYCCGTARDSVIILLSANAIYLGVVIIFRTIVTSMIPGLSSEDLVYTPIATLLTPMGFCYYLDGYLVGQQTTALWTTIIWSILYTTAAIILGNLAAKTRKAETAQSEFNIKWLPVVIKVGMSVLAGGFAGMIGAFSARSGYNNMYSFFIWYIIIGFAALFILHLIFSKGVKGKFLPTLIAYVSTTAGIFILIFAISEGLGIDTYVPDVSNIESVEFDNHVFYEPENIETVTQIHKIVIEGMQKECPRPYYIGSSKEHYYWDSELKPILQFVSYSFRYNKKIGFTTYRKYGTIDSYHEQNFDLDGIEQLMKKLYNSEEYKQQSNQLIWKYNGVGSNGELPKRVILTYFVYNHDDDDYSDNSDIKYEFIDDESVSTDKVFIDGLMKALKEDILSDDEYYVKTNMLYYRQDDSTYLGESYMELDLDYKLPSISSESYVMKNSTILITNDYTNTWNYLNSCGLKTNTWQHYLSSDERFFD